MRKESYPWEKPKKKKEVTSPNIMSTVKNMQRYHRPKSHLEQQQIHRVLCVAIDKE